jgi:pentatricopeptide repeat protein
MEQYRKSEEHLVRAEKSSPGSPRFARRHAEIAEGRAESYKRQKNWAAAITAYNTVAGIAEDLTRRDPKSERDLNGLPALYTMLADCYASAGQVNEAVEAMGKALDRYQQIASRRRLLATEEQGRQEALTKLAGWKQR